MPKKKPTEPQADSRIKIPPGAAIYGVVSATDLNGTPAIDIHGIGGHHTSLRAKKGAVEVTLPSTTIIGIHPGKYFIAWDGANYKAMPTLESIQETDHLTFIGSVVVPPFGLLADKAAASGAGLASRSPLLIMDEARRVQHSERPPLHQLTQEAAEHLLHRVDQIHWPLIAKLRVPKFIPLDTPVPPQTPEMLLGQLVWYASRLFKEEAEQYKGFHGNAAYFHWLQRLAERVIKRVVTALNRLEDGDPNSLLASYHNLQPQRTEGRLREVLTELAEGYARSPSGTMANPTYAQPQPEPQQAAEPAAEETIGQQIERLRIECDVTVEELAGVLEVDVRQIYRHQKGTTVPRKTHIAKYQKFFSEKLSRMVTLRTSAKRHAKASKRQ